MTEFSKKPQLYLIRGSAVPVERCNLRGHIESLLSVALASPTIYSRYANSKLLSLFISLEIDYFHSQ
jgi:hypothetical protein